MIRVLGPTPADVLEVAAEMTGVSVDDLTSQGRGYAKVAEARTIVCLAMRLATDASYPLIAHTLSDRHHTTVIQARQRAMRSPRLKCAAEAIAAEVRRRCELPEAPE